MACCEQGKLGATGGEQRVRLYKQRINALLHDVGKDGDDFLRAGGRDELDRPSKRRSSFADIRYLRLPGRALKPARRRLSGREV
jgi:hypothetical protein